MDDHSIGHTSWLQGTTRGAFGSSTQSMFKVQPAVTALSQLAFMYHQGKGIFVASGDQMSAAAAAAQTAGMTTWANAAPYAVPSSGRLLQQALNQTLQPGIGQWRANGEPLSLC
jgi:hypothetical protein